MSRIWAIARRDLLHAFTTPLAWLVLAAWTFVSMIAMFALTHTPLGRIANAVRDNPERAEFIGYNTQVVRYIAFILSGFFMGISGGLAALNFEIVPAPPKKGKKGGKAGVKAGA